MIKCNECNVEFENVITWKHLIQHNMSTTEYKAKHGADSLASVEFREKRSKQCTGKNNPNFNNKWSDDKRAKLSEKKKGKIPHNKNKAMSEEQKQLLSQKALERNKIWDETNTHPIVGQKRSEETKAKIKLARNKQIITPESVQKAIQTKRDRGHDLAFFRGKKHKDSSKEKIREASKNNAKLKTENSIKEYAARLSAINVSIVRVEKNIIQLHCNNCNDTFSFTRQLVTESKFTDKLCPTCYPRQVVTSNAENEIAVWIESQGIDIIKNDRLILNGLELDILIPTLNIAVEYCGLYWHSELIGKDSKYHINKKNLCEQKGIRLITIFEDEWINKRDIVEDRLTHILNKSNKIKLNARTCVLKEIQANEANQFLKTHHIQGSGTANIKYGAYYKDELVSVMTFSKSNITKKLNGWEIARFASKYNVRGIASKMFTKFVNEHLPKQVISFADLRWSDSDAFYEKLGFVKDKVTAPSYWYFKPNEIKRYHRFGLRKNVDDIQELTEWENRQLEGWNRIWDCGTVKYIWKSPS